MQCGCDERGIAPGTGQCLQVNDAPDTSTRDQFDCRMCPAQRATQSLETGT